MQTEIQSNIQTEMQVESQIDSTPIFIPLIGQYHNIGDVILRRPLAKWLRGCGQLHVFTGNAPESYVRALELDNNVKIYRSFKNWYWKAFRSSFNVRSAYIFKPGEIQLSLSGMKEHLGLLPLMVWIKLFHGYIVRLGSGSRNFSSFYRTLLKPSVMLADYVFWRDSATAKYLKEGAVMPDLGFYEGSDINDFLPESERDLLVVSMRGDRELISKPLCDVISAFALSHGLKIVIVTQVEIDSQRTSELASMLDAEEINWNGSGHDIQETKLRNLFARSAITVSDRLHVLVAAHTEGSIPAGIQTDASDKIQRHFDVININDASIPSVGLTKKSLLAHLQNRFSSRQSDMQALKNARRDLDNIREILLQKLGALSDD